jgi:hypothetical protein
MNAQRLVPTLPFCGNLAAALGNREVKLTDLDGQHNFGFFEQWRSQGFPELVAAVTEVLAQVGWNLALEVVKGASAKQVLRQLGVRIFGGGRRGR